MNNTLELWEHKLRLLTEYLFQGKDEHMYVAALEKFLLRR
jgi:hypothetical protein